MMRTLLIGTATLALALPLVGQASAAPAAKDPMCAIGSQGTNQSWADRYGCWGHYAPTKVSAQPSRGPAKDPMCGLPITGGSQSWAQYYHCW
jgi:hypothetical protein